ncbi:MAG: hypothetical protein RLY82_734, partial [Pseudomonadota bacterium]
MNALQALSDVALRGTAVTVPLADGDEFTVQFLGESLARVTLKPVAGFKEPRTWAIAPNGTPDV